MPASRIAIASLVALGLQSAGCLANAFACEDDVACRDGDVMGVCEPNGGCSFPDPSCASGRRFGKRGPSDVAGECVAYAGDSSTGTTEASSLTGLEATGPNPTSSGSTGPGTESSSGSTGIPMGTTGECPSDWLDCDATRRLRLIANPESPQLGVPVPLRLTPERFDYAAAAADGSDLRVLDATGTPLPIEIEAWVDGGESIVWVRVETVEANGEVALYWGGAAPVGARPPTAVWSDHAAVFHLDASAADASGYSAPGVASGTTQTGPGRLADGQVFSDAESRLDVPSSDAVDDLCAASCTVSAWMFAESWGGTNRGRIADKTGGGGGGWMFYGSGDAGGDLRWRRAYPSGQVIWSTAPESLTLGEWHFVAAVFDAAVGVDPRLFIDGAEAEVMADAPALGRALPDAGSALLVGNSLLPERWFDGTLDELRLERVARSPEWIALQYQAMTDALFTYGPVESLP